jgi:hypothetical protein
LMKMMILMVIFVWMNQESHKTSLVKLRLSMLFKDAKNAISFPSRSSCFLSLRLVSYRFI